MKDFVTEKFFDQAHCSSVIGVDFLAGKSDQFLSVGQVFRGIICHTIL